MSRNAAAATAGKCPTPRIDSHRLMAGQRALVIEHAGQEYHLRVTRNDKLILTK
ncbi:MAG: hemin uptake protein HemP [Tahibacter sp.]